MRVFIKAARFPLLLGGIALLAVSEPGYGQDSGPIRRTLGQHTFLPSTLLGDPFTGTYVRNLTGGGMAVGLQVPKLNLDEQVLEYQDADIGFLAIGMEYQQSVTGWLAFRLGFTGGARLGTSGTALLAEGVTAQAGATLGATARLIRTDRFLLSASADVLPGISYQISILDYVRDVVENGFENASGLVNESSPYRWRFGGNAAYAVNQWLGVQATATAGPAQVGEDKETEVRFGGSASLDFDPIGPPIGVLLGYLYTDPSGGADVTGGAGISNLGVFYTGHKRFVVGLDLQFTSVDQAVGDKKVDVATGRIVLRYDFK